MADIARVTVLDLAHITYFERKPLADGHAVLVNLVNDGSVTVTYDQAGVVRNVKANHVEWHIRDDGVITLASMGSTA